MGLFLLLCCLPAIETVLAQLCETIPGIEVAVPWLARYTDHVPRGAVGKALARQREINAVRRAFDDMRRERTAPPALDDCRRSDAGNGLYDYLDLLLLLRSGQGGDPAVLAQLRRLSFAPPARLHVLRALQIVQEALHREGVSRRRAAVVAWESCTYVQQPYGSTLRELARLLAVKGAGWREAGRAEDARLAHSAIVRLATDLAKDSPAPDIVLLASETTASACRELALDCAAAQSSTQQASAASEPARRLPALPDARAFESAASKAAALGEAWYRRVDAEGVGVLPWMGASIHVLLAGPEHRQVMAALVASALAGECCLILLALLAVVIVATVATRMPSEVELNWRCGRWGPWSAALLPVVPLVVIWMFLRLADVDFTWLLSAPSAVGLGLIPALTVIFVGIAAHGTAVPVEKSRRYAWSLNGVCAAAVVLLVTLALVGGAIGSEVSWRPPTCVRVFRAAGFLLSILCLLMVAVWIIANTRRMLQGRFSLAVLSRAFLPVAAAAFLFAGVLTFAFLKLNEVNNTAHQQAFARAAADPVADCLGPDWYRDHLAGARALAETIESR